MESFDQSQPRWTRDHCDVFPLLVSLQNFTGHSTELFLDSAVLLDLPHTRVYPYPIWHVKESSSAASVSRPSGAFLIPRLGFTAPRDRVQGGVLNQGMLLTEKGFFDTVGRVVSTEE